MHKIFLVVCLSIASFSFAQRLIDVQHYRFEIQLSDKNDSIFGTAVIKIKALDKITQFDLDLHSVKNGKGMYVKDVKNTTANTNLLRYKHVGEKLTLQFMDTIQKDEVREIAISYAGIPKDGLIISKNKWGDRTFFADNWPNRAHHWIPSIDAPDDKASFEFIVTAPAHYDVISNGVKLGERTIEGGNKITHWKEDIPLSTKIMVIGVARFAIKTFDDSPKNLPVSAWVYPQDSAKGFYDYALATGIVKYFSEYIAPYPYTKLANVQSKTIFGGMENASAIFYSESSVTGDRSAEDLIAHEVAHQWFGNMASEKYFSHLWLSEGFATYMTNMYIESKYGREAMNGRLKKERDQVISFLKRNDLPVVDSVSNLMALLNANSYQKGSWFLHMLRKEVGEEKFQKIIQSYYQQFKGGNAETRDLIKVATNVMREDMRPFFHQWLYKPGVPKIKVEWKHEKNKLVFKVQQLQKNLYQLPLEVEITESDGTTRIVGLNINKAVEVISLPALNKPSKISLDPNVNLLFEGSISKGK